MIHTDAGYYTPVPPPSGSGSPTYMHVWYLKDHLGNNRVLADGTGTALRKHHYDPFGEAITLTGAAASPFPTGATESPYKYGGKEWDSTTSSYDFEARQFSPNFHRFTTMDPLCEKYYGISPYAYCANNPVNLMDPEGKGPVGRIVYHLTSYCLENHTNNHTLRTIGYVMSNPYIAYKTGPGLEMFVGISAIAGKFSINMMNAAGFPENEMGTPKNAFRHTLWQAMLTTEFGENNAIRVGNAHEDNTKIDLSQTFFESQVEADTAADLLNNQIGRSIALENPNLSNKDLAFLVLAYYHSEGLWVMERSDSGFQIRQQQLTENEYLNALYVLFGLHENGLKN